MTSSLSLMLLIVEEQLSLTLPLCDVCIYIYILVQAFVTHMAAFSELSGSQAQLETISTIMDEKISAAAEIYGCVNPSSFVFLP